MAIPDTQDTREKNETMKSFALLRLKINDIRLMKTDSDQEIKCHGSNREMHNYSLKTRKSGAHAHAL